VGNGCGLDTAEAKATMERELQPTLLEGLTALCKEKPRADGLEAVDWLADWLLAHNPNKAQPKECEPNGRAVEEADPLPAPPPEKGAKAIDERITRNI